MHPCPSPPNARVLSSELGLCPAALDPFRRPAASPLTLICSASSYLQQKTSRPHDKALELLPLQRVQMDSRNFSFCTSS